MNNLFRYATKELSQDAFLLWLLSNSCENDDKDTKDTSLAFISFLIGKEDIEINGIELWAQKDHIDITAEINTDKGLILVFIEDKTTTEEHNQLITYNKRISDSCKMKRIYKTYRLFYKTDLIEKDERERIENAKWKIVELEQIKSFWENYTSSKNLIINMYANRIIKIYNALNTASLPKEEEDREIEMLMWKGFFNNYIVPEIEGLCSVYVGKSYYKYVYLKVRPLGRMKVNIPSLEVRDRDCLGKKIKSLILTYGMSEKKKRIQDWDRIIDINKALPESGFKPCRKNATKTVLLTDDKKVCDSTEFLEELKKCINIYLEIMNQLENRG